METNDLKNFVDVNREEFEVYNYEANDWEDIAKKLDETRPHKKSVVVPLTYIWRVAAVVIIVLGATFYTSWVNWKTQSNQLMISAELQEAAYYYNDLIAIKVAEISKLDHTVEQEVFRNMEALDQAFLELKADLQDNADNEEVIYAMIDNYKIKLKVLEQILAQLEEKKEL